MLNGLDVFSGIGGISLALKEWVRPIAYCEIDRYCQAVLLNRMGDGAINRSPIWDDIRTFCASQFPKGSVDIIYGGFPCQGISVAGHGKGLADERSGLFFEIVRIAKEIQPRWIFLENVPAITSRGGVTIITEIAKMGFDARWCCISASSIGALHRRERWFLLGYSKHAGRDGTQERGSTEASIYPCQEGEKETSESERASPSSMLATESMADSSGKTDWEDSSQQMQRQKQQSGTSSESPDVANSKREKCSRLSSREKKGQSSIRVCGEYASVDQWQEAVSNVCRVTDGISQRVDRIRGLGNAVVPKQAKEAFEILMGLK